MPNFQAFTEQYQARSEPIDTGMDSCRTNLTMYHRDTLLRYLPKGIRVRVYDENSGTYDANRQAKLPEPYLKQIKHYGDSVTFFIHGYNVALGKLGEFPTADELGKKPVYP